METKDKVKVFQTSIIHFLSLYNGFYLENFRFTYIHIILYLFYIFFHENLLYYHLHFYFYTYEYIEHIKYLS